MINLLISFCVIVALLFFGKIYEAIKRLICFITEISLRFLNLIGIKVVGKKQVLKTSKNFNNTFRDIATVRKSKQNVKLNSSINFPALVILLLSLICLGVNLTHENLIFQIFKTLLNIQGIESNEFTTIINSIAIASISFSTSKLLSQWKATEQDRKAKKDMKLKSKALSLLSSKELLEEIKRKDSENFSRLAAESKTQDNTKHGRDF